MKRIILSLMVLGFAVAVQAGDAQTGQTTEQPKSACCSAKVKTSNEANATCPFAKSQCCKDKAATQAPVKQPVLMSPKASDLRQ